MGLHVLGDWRLYAGVGSNGHTGKGQVVLPRTPSFHSKDPMHLLDALSQFLTQLHADGRRSHTRNQYQRHVKCFARWLAAEGRSAEVGDLDHQAIAHFLVSASALRRPDGVEKKASSVNTLRSSLRVFFGHLHELGETPVNPGRLIRLARTSPPPPRSMTEAEEQRFAATLESAQTPAEQRDRVLFLLLMHTGIRLSSALDLRVEDLDLDGGEAWLRSTKGDRPDRVYLPQGAIDMLKPWTAKVGAGYLFTGEPGLRLGTRQAHRRFKAVLKRAGITTPASPHWLRHGFAMRIYRQTGDILLVKEALLHRSITSSLTYAHCCRQRLRSVIQAG